MQQEEFRDRIVELIDSTFPLLGVMFDEVTMEQLGVFYSGITSIASDVLKDCKNTKEL